MNDFKCMYSGPLRGQLSGVPSYDELTVLSHICCEVHIEDNFLSGM